VPGTHQGLDSHTKDSDAELKVGLRFGGVWENHMSTKQRGRKVWLVSWVWCGDHAKRDPKVVAIFRPQLSGERVRELVEFLYGHFEYSLRERVDCALNSELLAAFAGQVRSTAATIHISKRVSLTTSLSMRTTTRPGSNVNGQEWELRCCHNGPVSRWRSLNLRFRSSAPTSGHNA